MQRKPKKPKMPKRKRKFLILFGFLGFLGIFGFLSQKLLNTVFFLAITHLHHYPSAIMPRGKRTVFTVSCSESKNRIGSLRLHKQDKKGKAWKEHAQKLVKYCPVCKKRVKVTLKEERHAK